MGFQMSTIHLQSIGKVPAIQAQELRIGSIVLWNFGGKSKVVSILKETACFITFEMYCTETKKNFERKLKKTRLVGFVSHADDIQEPKAIRVEIETKEEILIKKAQILIKERKEMLRFCIKSHGSIHPATSAHQDIINSIMSSFNQLVCMYNMNKSMSGCQEYVDKSYSKLKNIVDKYS